MPNPLCHFEFMVANPQACKAFYGDVFDWQFDDDSMPGYSLINPGGEPNGGMFKMPEDVEIPTLNIYFQVDDVDAALARALQAGGKIIVPKTEIPNVGTFGIISDPEGLVVGMLNPSA